MANRCRPYGYCELKAWQDYVVVLRLCLGLQVAGCAASPGVVAAGPHSGCISLVYLPAPAWLLMR